MSEFVGVYLCPRGAYVIECRFTGEGIEVLRAVPAPAKLDSGEQAAAHLVSVLASSGMRRSRVAIAVRGFDVGHHVLSLPPAKNAVLDPIIDREVRRLEPQIADPVLGWTPLAPEPSAADSLAQVHVLAGVAPRTMADVIEHQLRSAGHTLTHLTAAPAAIQRLQDEFDGGLQTHALIAPLPDGPFLGFFLHGALRLAVEPPFHDQESPDASAMAEEMELGAMFVRQQFRGAQIERVVVAAPPSVIPEAEDALSLKLAVPVSRMDIQGLGPAELAALGAILDSQASHPLSLGGTSTTAGQDAARRTLRAAAVLAVVATMLVGGWTVYQAISARRASAELRDARRRVEQESFGIRPMRETADQRKLMRDAIAALRFAGRERLELARMLADLAGAVVDPISLDSLHLDRGTDGWVASMAGRAIAATNGRAVQALHEFYRDLPRRVILEQLSLEELAYADSAGVGGVRFQLSFVLPAAKE